MADATSGARIFVDQEAVPMSDDKALDVQTDDTGQFPVRDHASAAATPLSPTRARHRENQHGRSPWWFFADDAFGGVNPVVQGALRDAMAGKPAMGFAPPSIRIAFGK